MRFKKRKVVETGDSSEDDNFQRKRSSLKVNLSYTSNLTMDSGNSSLNESQVANDKTLIEETPLYVGDFLRNVTVRKNTRNRRNNSTSTKHNSGACIDKIIPSDKIYVVIDKMSCSDVKDRKNLNESQAEIAESNTVKSTDINNKAEALNKSCEQLKDAILRKTREIFDHRNEFSIKTTKVLINDKGTPGNSPSEECTSLPCVLQKDQAIVSDQTTNLSENATSVYTNCSKYKDYEGKSVGDINEPQNVSKQNIISTPKNTRSENNSTSSFHESSSLKRRLFVYDDNQAEDSTEETTSTAPFLNDIKNSKSPVFNENVQRNLVGRLSLRSSASKSPILSGNCKIINSSNVSMKSQRKRVAVHCSGEGKNNTSPILSQNICKLNLSRISLQSSKEITNLSLGLPVTCSSFLEDNVKLIGNEKEKDSEETESVEPTIFYTNRNSESKYTLESMDTTEVQENLLSVNGTARCLENSQSLLPTKYHIADNKKNVENENSKLKSNSNNGKDENLDRASLNMNTSLDGITNQENVPCNREFVIPETPKRITRMNKAPRNDEVYKALPTELTTIYEVSASEENAILSRSTCTTSEDKHSKTMMKEPLLQELDQSKNKDESTNTIRTSLAVNTSIDSRYSVMRKNSYENKIEESTSYEESSDNRIEDVGVKVKRYIVETRQNRTHRFRSSLRVNTSLDPINKSLVDDVGNHHKTFPNEQENLEITEKQQLADKSTETAMKINSEEESDLSSLENVSLMERLRNISVKRQTGSDCSIKKKRDELINAKMQEKQSVNKANEFNGDGPSYVEGTPYPISRSILLRSQLKCNTVNSNMDSQSSVSNNNSNVNNKESSSDESDNSLKAKLPIPSSKVQAIRTTSSINKRKSSALHNSSVLDDSSSDSEPTGNKKCEKIIIDDSLEKVEPRRNDEQKISSINISKGNKRKLLPLHDCSQLVSFSPVQARRGTPKKQKMKSKHYKVKNNIRTRAINYKKMCQMELEDKGIENSERLSSDEEPVTFKTQELKPKRHRKIVSKEIIVKKINHFDVPDELKRNKESSIDRDNCSVISRGSLNDFAVKRKAYNEGGRKSKTNQIIIVTTGLSKDDKNLVKSVIKSLGSAKMEIIVTRRTTHIVSSGVRTINLLRGIIRGCWLVSLDWVLKSLECEKWLEPMTYEMSHFSKAVRENRRDRQMFGDAYVPELFATCGLIYVENSATPSASILKELVKTAGGRITEKPENARIIVGVEGLKEIWILDSITTGDLQPFDQYCRN